MAKQHGGRAVRDRRNKAHYGLRDVKGLLDEGKVEFRPRALKTAHDQLGWGPDDVIRALKQLKPQDFRKRMDRGAEPFVRMDVYVGKVCGEEIYTHFFVDPATGVLVVDSFKLK